MFDFFVLVSGASRRQLHAISEEIDRVMEEELGDRRMGIEGYEESRWILLDYGDVVIHMFEPETRDLLRDGGAVGPGQTRAGGTMRETKRGMRNESIWDLIRLAGTAFILHLSSLIPFFCLLSPRVCHDFASQSSSPISPGAGRVYRSARAVAGNDPPRPGRPLWRLPGQLRHGAGQAVDTRSRKSWPPRSSPGSTWPISATRRKSPGRASSICGCRTRGSSSSLRPRSTIRAWALSRQRQPRTYVIDFSGSQRGQADARRPYPLDRDRRRPLPHAPLPRP